MTCAGCGKEKSRYNTRRLCYACDDLVDDWDEAVRLPQDNLWESYPSPEDGEELAHYVRRLLTHSAGSVPLYPICQHYGFDKRKLDSVVGSSKKWFRNRGCMMVNDHRGGGYRLEKCEL